MNLLTAVLSLLSFVLKLFGLGKSKLDPVTQTIQIANAESQISAETARQTYVNTQKELSDVKAQTDATVAVVRDASSLRDVANAVQGAVNAANKQSGADD